MKRIILFVLLFAALKVAGQTTGYLRFDTVKIMKQNGTCELYIINKTKDTLGILTNIGGGLTNFKRSRALNDSQVVVGVDTLTIRGSGGSIQNIYVAYVDSAFGNNGTGLINRPDKPFATINAALDATASLSKRIIQIGSGTYASPDSAKIKSYTWFRGSGKPKPNWTVAVPSVDGDTKTSPTAMLGGTIINGSFWFNTQRLQNIIVTDLGVDVGSDWCTAHNGGNPAEGFVFTTGYVPGSGNAADGGHFLQSVTTPLQGLVIRNISSLCQSSTAPVHAALFENCFAPDIDGVSTYFGTHGIVFKTIGGVASNLEAFGHSNDGIIVKSNDYANCYRLSISNFNIGSIGVYDGAGLILDANDAGSPGLYFCNISNGTINRTTFGIRTQGSTIDGNNLSNIEVNVAQGNGIDILSGFAFGSLENIKARSCGGIGFNIASGQMGITINDCDAHDNASDGFRFNAVTNANFDNINAILNDGYGINVISGNVYSGTYYTETNGSGSTNGTLIPKNPTATPNLQSVTNVGATTTNTVSITGYNTSGSKLTIADLVHQPYGLNNTFLVDNAYFNGSSWTRLNTGYAGKVHYYNGQIMLSNATTGSGTPTFITGFKTDYNGHVGLGGNIDDVTYSGSKMFIDGSSGNVLINTLTDGGEKLQVNGTARITGATQLSNLSASGTRMVTADAGGNLGTTTIPSGGITSINSQTGPSITIAAGNDIDVSTTTNTVTIAKKISDQVHTSGTSVTISNGVTRLYVDPASALASLSITMPSTPYDGQVVKIFFGGISIQSGASDVVTGGITGWSASGSGFVPIAPSVPNPVKAGTVLVFEYKASSTLWYQIQ